MEARVGIGSCVERSRSVTDQHRFRARKPRLLATSHQLTETLLSSVVTGGYQSSKLANVANYMHPVIRVSGIRKTYGRTVAVDEVSLEVSEGEIFGLIGPNGAGKTTTMECIEGLRKPDRGAISVLGLDPHREVYKL